MFPIELNQGGNYLIIRLCLTRPCKRETESWRERRGMERGEREGGGGSRNIEIKAVKKSEQEIKEQISRSIFLSL